MFELLIVYLLVALLFALTLNAEWDWRAATILGLLWLPLLFAGIFRAIRDRMTLS